jgi:hypothetical protein
MGVRINPGNSQRAKIIIHEYGGYKISLPSTPQPVPRSLAVPGIGGLKVTGISGIDKSTHHLFIKTSETQARGLRHLYIAILDKRGRQAGHQLVPLRDIY